MSAAHTEGLLVVGEIKGNSIELKHTNGDVPGAISLVVARVTARLTWIVEANANARRLAACWNAFDGMPTEASEELAEIGGVQGLTNDLSAAMTVIEVARTLLSDALETFDENPHRDHEIADRIRAFLKGGAA